MESNQQSTLNPVGDILNKIEALLEELNPHKINEGETIAAYTRLLIDWMKEYESLRKQLENNYYAASFELVEKLSQLLKDINEFSTTTIELIYQNLHGDTNLESLGKLLSRAQGLCGSSQVGSIFTTVEINNNLEALIAPNSLYLETNAPDNIYDYNVWMVVQNSTPQELKAAGKRAKLFKEQYGDYKGLARWLSERILTYNEEQISFLQDKYDNPSPEAEEMLQQVLTLINNLDKANVTLESSSNLVLEETAILGDYTDSQVETLEKISQMAVDLKKFLEHNWKYFFHVKTPDGIDLLSLLDTAISEGACNNALCGKMRIALKGTYMEVPYFVKIYNHLKKGGYFDYSGDKH